MYNYITINQIIAIEEYKKYGYSIRTIASKTDCSKSTTHRISKQLAVGITPIEIFSQLETNQRKAGRKIIELNESDVKTVTYLLTKEGYAPDIISNNLRKTNPSTVSTKTLYNMFNTNRHGWNKNMLLRKGKNKPHKKIENRGSIKDSKSIHERNILYPDIKKTQEFGHLEGDTLVGKDHKSSLL